MHKNTMDAILAKKNLGTHRAMAPITVALGPGFTAGEDVDAVIETKRGHNLGRVLWAGSAAPNTGIPGIIGGYGMLLNSDEVFMELMYQNQTISLFISVITAIAFGLIGFVDDYIKVVKKRNLGLTEKQKLVLQFAVTAIYIVLYFFISLYIVLYILFIIFSFLFIY